MNAPTKRNTRQRTSIIDFLKTRKEFISAKELYSEMEGSKVGLSTIYRALSDLVNDGDLDVFIDREKENIVIVDNSIMSFAFDLDNGVPIQSFMGNEEEDKELLFLISFLEEAFYTQDVRPSIREAFKLSYLMGTIENDTDAANAAKK